MDEQVLMELRTAFLRKCRIHVRPAATLAIDRLLDFSRRHATAVHLDYRDDLEQTNVCIQLRERKATLWKAYAASEKVEFLIRWPETLSHAEGEMFRAEWKRVRPVGLPRNGPGSVASLPFPALGREATWAAVVDVMTWACQLGARDDTATS